MSRVLDEFLDGADSWAEPFVDILSIDPSLSIEDALRLQFAFSKRRSARGDKLVGYKATSGAFASADNYQGRKAPRIVVGALHQSCILPEGTPFPLRTGKTFIEAEIAVMLKEDLCGPGVTPLDVIRAIGGIFPAVEVSPWAPAAVNKQRSPQHLIAALKTDGHVILGSPMRTLHGFDPRLEGAILEINGEVRGSGTAVQVMGNPMNAVAYMANQVAEFGGRLAAGMILMTGSIGTPAAAERGDSDARALFTTLGSVVVRFLRQ